MEIATALGCRTVLFAFIRVYSRLFAASRVGPERPRGSRLGPDRTNRLSGLVATSKITPMKQLLISSQFCGPHQISLDGSGLKRLLAELSKCEIPTMRVPLGKSMGFA